MALIWDRIPRYARIALATGLAVSLTFRWLILPFPVIMPVKPLWPYAWELFGRSRTLAPYAYLVIATLAAAATTWFVLRSRRNDTDSWPMHVAAMNPQER